MTTGHWALLEAEIENCEQRLLSSYKSIWRETAALLQSNPDNTNLDLPAVVNDILAIRPQRRALQALETYRAGLEDLSRRMPDTVILSGGELIETIGAEHVSRLKGMLLAWRKQVQIPLAAIVETFSLENSDCRASVDGAYILLLAQAELEVLTPWQEMQRSTLRRLAGREVGVTPAGKSDFGAAAARIFDDLEAAARQSPESLMRATLRRHGAAHTSRNEALRLRRQRRFRFWSRSQRALTAMLDLEAQMARLAADLPQAASAALNALDAEHAALREEIDSAVAWMENREHGMPPAPYPAPSAKLLSAEARATGWRQSVEEAARNLLPVQVESFEPRNALPSRREPWRTLRPLQAFLSELATTGYPKALDGFRHAEAEHRSIVREIERAREVVAYSLESSVPEPAIAREGLQNALALLIHQREVATPQHGVVERRLIEAAAATLLSTHTRLERSRLGLIAQLARESGSRAFRAGVQVLLDKTTAGGGRVQEEVAESYHRALLRIGWEAPPISAPEAVIKRGYLGDVLDLRRGDRDLPAIYRRLFRIEAVEDPRFLVGREVELAALAQAREMWKSHRAVSILVVGARGSGKTSLLNCAVAKEFADGDVIRSQFNERITSRDGMRQYLLRLLGASDGESGLEASRRTVVILEELERVFLRRMDGFEALRELLSVVSATSRTTLWILGLNEHSYRYLDAAIGLGEYFSHRINAMAIPEADLKTAILLRHKLSGLRLQYPEPPASDPRVDRFRSAIGLRKTSEELFFDALYSQSQGIFRSAFELWQHYTERAEGGVLYMKQPVEADLEPIIASFSQDDAFTLQAILQHGSLTVQDHSEVFECTPEQSRLRLEKLSALECLEGDPAGPGLRIRPAAGRVVYSALHRLNLV